MTELGFTPARRVHMLEGTTTDVPKPVWPGDMTVAPLDLASDQDLTDGFTAFNAAFPPDSGGWRMEIEEYVHMLRRDPTAVPGLSLIARKAGSPVGVATNFRDTTREETGNVVQYQEWLPRHDVGAWGVRCSRSPFGSFMRWGGRMPGSRSSPM